MSDPIEKERELLGVLLVRPELLSEIAPNLEAADFSDARNARIYAAMVKLADDGKEFDLDPIKAAAGADAATYLGSLMDGMPRMPSAKALAEEIRKRGTMRRVLAKLNVLAAEVNDALNGVADADGYETKLAKLAVEASKRTRMRRKSTFNDRAKDVIEFLDDFERPVSALAIPTGIDGLDYRLGGGIRRGRLYTFAASTGSGKSSFITQVARTIAEDGRRVLIFSLEMDDVELYVRDVERESKVSKWDRRRKSTQEEARAAHVLAINRLLSRPGPTVVYEAMLTVDQIRREAMAEKVERGVLDVVAVDYAQIVAPPLEGKKNEPRYLQVRTIAEGLRAMAQELGVSVVVSAQLNPPEKGRPTIGHIRESRDLANTSDAVVLIHHEYETRDGRREIHSSEMIVEKNRAGGMGVMPVVFDPKTYRFESIADRDRRRDESEG